MDIRQCIRAGTVPPTAASVDFSYRYPFADGERDIHRPITIARTPCYLGGSRSWFICPRCGRNCAVLYLHGWPRCRRYARLVYPSQSADAVGRSWRRTTKIERRLGWEDGKPRRKPAWMRRATFERLQGRLIAEELLRNDMLAAFAARMFRLTVERH